MRTKFSFPYEDISVDVVKCKFILNKKQFKMLLLFTEHKNDLLL